MNLGSNDFPSRMDEVQWTAVSVEARSKRE